MRLTSAFAVILLAGSVAAFAQAPGIARAKAALALAKSEPAPYQPAIGWDTTAKLLAGIDPSNMPAMPPDLQAAWTEHRSAAARDWRRLKARYLDRIDNWSHQHLPASKDTTIFYPFSGPDAATAFAFFPDARDYVLVGLESPGTVPLTAADYTADYWASVREALRSDVAVGFFKTEEMHEDFKHEGVNGVMPLLLTFIARRGYTIDDVSQIQISDSGAVVPRTPPVPGVRVTKGVAIRFSANRTSHTLTYLRLDLSNVVESRPAAIQYLHNLKKVDTLVKSASYLMHKRHFSTVRGIILAQSDVIVEDDSGIPWHYFTPDAWNVTLFGAYTEPITLFADWYQEDLKTAFDSTPNIQRLDFGIGYRWRPGASNLLLAARKK